HDGSVRRRWVFARRRRGSDGLRGFGRPGDETIPLQRAIDFWKIGRLIARRRLHQRAARQRTRDVDVVPVEACETIGRSLRRRGSDRTAKTVGGELDIAGGGGYALLPAFGDARLPGQQ